MCSILQKTAKIDRIICQPHDTVKHHETANSQDALDFRRHDAYYYTTVMADKSRVAILKTQEYDPF